MSLQELVPFQSYTATTTATQFSVKNICLTTLFVHTIAITIPTISFFLYCIYFSPHYFVFSQNHPYNSYQQFLSQHQSHFKRPQPRPPTTFSYSHPYSPHQIFFSLPQPFNQFKLCQAPNVERRFVRAGTVVISPCLPKA